jgi:hypothetical protein
MNRDQHQGKSAISAQSFGRTEQLRVTNSIFCIREVHSSNLGRVAGYPEDSCGFPQSLQANTGIVLRNKIV